MGGLGQFNNRYDQYGNLLVNAVGSVGNASVSLVTSPVPTYATAIGIEDGSGNLQFVSAANPLPTSATVLSVGTLGAAIPTSGNFIAASDGTDLRGLLVESSTVFNLRTGIWQGALQATVTAAHALKVDGSAVTQPTEDAADGTPGSAIPLLAIMVAGSDGTDLRALATNATGNLQVTALLSGGAVTDGSGTVATGGTSQQIFASNTSRQFLMVINPPTATELLYVNTGAAASTTAGSSYPIPIGGNLTFDSGFVPTGTVNVTAVTTGHAFIAKYS